MLLIVRTACQTTLPPLESPTQNGPPAAPTRAGPAPVVTRVSTYTPAPPPPAVPTVTPLATATPAPSPTAGPASAPPSAVVADLLNRINALRAQNGLAPYRLNDQLTAAAQRHSQDMANTGNISPTGSDGSTASQRIRESGYGEGCCENIFGGLAGAAGDAVQYWMENPGPRDNLLNPQFLDAGIGVATSGTGTYYTVTFGSGPGG